MIWTGFRHNEDKKNGASFAVFSVPSWKVLSYFSRKLGTGKDRAEAELSVLGSLE